MNKKEFNDFIHFSDQEDYIRNHLWNKEWITVYQRKDLIKNGYKDEICFYSCLVSEEKKDRLHRNPGNWTHRMGSGKPGIIEYDKPLNFIGHIKKKLFSTFLKKIYISNYLWTPEQLKKRATRKFKIKNFLYHILQFLIKHKTKEIKEYKRFNEDGIEPLIHIRRFESGNYPSYMEVSEEFRHYFNLYERHIDHKNKVFSSVDEKVIKIIDNKDREVKIKKKYLKEFLYIKKMWLCIQFDNRRWITTELDQKITESFCSGNGEYLYSLNSGNTDYEDKKTFIRFIGRKFIKYKNTDFLHYEQEEKYEEFSFIDGNGEEESWTCEKDKLADFSGKNPEAPDYLTLVSFRKDVLKKYYDKPNQYSVGDGYLDCAGAWSMEMDIQDDRVVVFLGDLSKLPYLEQKYWKSYNIIEKATISAVNFERSFECKWAETDRPDFFFKKQYKIFNGKWKEKYGWLFFKPLSNEDRYCFDALRVPLNEEQSEFDNQIMYLVKIFIESINTKEIKKELPKKYELNNKSIDALKMFLKSKDIENVRMIEFLKNLQKLRSKGSAHRKNKDYEKTLNYFKKLKGVQNLESKIQVFSQILVRCMWTINALNDLFLLPRRSEMEDKK